MPVTAANPFKRRQYPVEVMRNAVRWCLLGSRLRKWAQGAARNRAYAEKGNRASRCFPGAGIVERIFAWLGRYRLLECDYQCLPQTTEALIHTAMIHLMLRRLTA